jgi:uncharacterized damage-inducible protein DinB
MVESLKMFAAYNAAVNKKLYTVLAAQPEEVLSRESGSYYHSIFGLLNHILRSDINWMVRYRTALPNNAALKDSAVDPPGDVAPGALLYPALAPLRERREKVDAVYLAFTRGLSDEEAKTVVVYKDPKGVEVRTVLGTRMLHVFNHATHHRGAISQILDAFGVENDFSALAPIIEG